MTTAKSKTSAKTKQDNLLAFGTATADPQTMERFRINDRIFYQREFTAAEEAGFLRDTETGRDEARKVGEMWLTEDEVGLLSGPLNKRIADGGDPISGEWVSEAITAKDYRGLLQILSPNIARLYDAIQKVGGGAEGK